MTSVTVAGLGTRLGGGGSTDQMRDTSNADPADREVVRA
jgi:hypothetical protein